MHHACLECGCKFRSIDLKASDISEIRREMRAQGIPYRIEKEQWKQ